MSESEAPPSANSLGYGPVKTLAVRLNESTRAQLDIIAQLNDRTVTDEIRLAIEAWIERTKSDPSTLQRAQFVREEIEREAAYADWLHHYNHHRPHTALAGSTPAERVHNLTGNYP